VPGLLPIPASRRFAAWGHSGHPGHSTQLWNERFTRVSRHQWRHLRWVRRRSGRGEVPPLACRARPDGRAPLPNASPLPSCISDPAAGLLEPEAQRPMRPTPPFSAATKAHWQPRLASDLARSGCPSIGTPWRSRSWDGRGGRVVAWPSRGSAGRGSALDGDPSAPSANCPAPLLRAGS